MPRWPKKTLEERLYEKCERNPETGCWEWVGNSLVDGYGRIKVAGSMVLSHRLSYELNVDRPPNDMCVLHTCDNRLCINPEHLYLGTKKDNMRDRKERTGYNSVVGANNPNSRLSAENVKDIRSSFESGEPQKSIAERYGVTAKYISKICRRTVWGSVT